MKVVKLGGNELQVEIRLEDGRKLYVADGGDGDFHVYTTERMAIRPVSRNEVYIGEKKEKLP